MITTDRTGPYAYENTSVSTSIRSLPIFSAGSLYHNFAGCTHVIHAWPAPASLVYRTSKGWKPDDKFAERIFSQYLDKNLWSTPSGPPAPTPVPLIIVNSAVEAVMREFRGKVDTKEHDKIIRGNQREYKRWYLRRTYCDFFSMIPERFRRVLMSFQQRRWRVLQFLAICDESLDLYRSNPALFFLLANHPVFRQGNDIEAKAIARRLIRLPQRDILGWLDYPATESVRKIFAKIQPQAVTARLLQRLRDALANTRASDLLAHLPFIDRDVLRLVTTPQISQYLSPRLLGEILERPKHPDIYILCMGVHYAVQLVGNSSVPFAINSTQQLRAIYNRFVERIGMDLYDTPVVRLRKHPVIFPPPPFKGTPDIIPISDVIMLFREGQEMHHCVSRHASSIAWGEEYMYRVLAPVRATASIRRQGNNWLLDQVRGHCNAKLDADNIAEIGAGIFGTKPQLSTKLD